MSDGSATTGGSGDTGELTNNFWIMGLIMAVEYYVPLFLGVILFFIGLIIAYLGERLGRYTKYIISFHAGFLVGSFLWLPTLSGGFILAFGCVLGVGSAIVAHQKKGTISGFFGLSLSVTIGILVFFLLVALFGPSLANSASSDQSSNDVGIMGVPNSVLNFARWNYTLFLVISISGCVFAYVIQDFIVLLNTVTLGSLVLTISVISMFQFDPFTSTGIKLVLVYLIFFLTAGAFQIWIRNNPNAIPGLHNAPINVELDLKSHLPSSYNTNNSTNTSNRNEISITLDQPKAPLYSQQTPPGQFSHPTPLDQANL